ncbi:hypothetical protein [Thermaerobacter litoralis]
MKRSGQEGTFFVEGVLGLMLGLVAGSSLLAALGRHDGFMAWDSLPMGERALFVATVVAVAVGVALLVPERWSLRWRPALVLVRPKCRCGREQGVVLRFWNREPTDEEIDQAVCRALPGWEKVDGTWWCSLCNGRGPGPEGGPFVLDVVLDRPQ